jgi:hypothetical protein
MRHKAIQGLASTLRLGRGVSASAEEKQKR